MRHNWTFVFTAAAVLAAAPLAAQETQNAATTPAATTPATQAPAATTPTAAPAIATPAEARFAPYAATKQGAVDRVNGENAVATAPMAAAAMRSPTRHNKAMMVVGVAGLLLGAVIGGEAGTIIMIGGGVIGLYGLYQYLQ